jgi:hypothetical protein
MTLYRPQTDHRQISLPYQLYLRLPARELLALKGI